MLDRKFNFLTTDDDQMGRKNEVLQRAASVIAATREAWICQKTGDEPVERRPRFADPLFRLALDAMSSKAARARGMRLRSRRRTPGQFAG
jgi:hypothetical protein